MTNVPAPSKSVSPLRAFLAALQFLTVSPQLLRGEFSPQLMGYSVGYYPLVGALLGLLVWGTAQLAGLVFPKEVVSALVLLVWIGLTGLLHLDGFLDSCDGILGGWTPEQRLEILRDERRGAFAIVGGIVLLLTKFASLNALPAGSLALLLAPVLGRWGMALAIVAFPYARPKGLGRDMKDNARWPQALLATLFTLGTAWLAMGLAGLGAAVLAGAVLWIMARYTMGRIPGLTGDLYGAFNEILEVVVLVFASGLPAGWLA